MIVGVIAFESGQLGPELFEADGIPALGHRGIGFRQYLSVGLYLAAEGDDPRFFIVKRFRFLIELHLQPLQHPQIGLQLLGQRTHIHFAVVFQPPFDNFQPLAHRLEFIIEEITGADRLGFANLEVFIDEKGCQPVGDSHHHPGVCSAEGNGKCIRILISLVSGRFQRYLDAFAQIGNLILHEHIFVARIREKMKLIDDVLEIGAAHNLLRYGVDTGLDVGADDGADIFFGNALGTNENQGTGLIGFGQRKHQDDADNHRQAKGDNNQPAAL